MPRISIIVPIYNRAKYINRLVLSILNQEFKDFELLLIDDGSTDDSLSICRECAKSDQRIVVLHKNNGGVSSARNLGIEKSNGEWLWFVDSDDYITDNALNIFVDAIDDDVDILRGGLIREKDGVISVTSVDHDFICESKEEIICSYYNTNYAAYLCNTLFRRKVIDSQRLDESISWCEDHLFHYEVLRNVRKVKFLSKPVYYYDAPSTSLASFGTNLSSRYLEPSMIIRGAIKEREAKLACLQINELEGRKVVDIAFDFKARHALKYAIVGNRYSEAISITHKYLGNNYKLLINYILHLKIAPLVKRNK